MWRHNAPGKAIANLPKFQTSEVGDPELGDTAEHKPTPPYRFTTTLSVRTPPIASVTVSR